MEEMFGTFEAELKNPHFSDEDARIEFYTLAKGIPKEMERALLNLLHQHRPFVAKRIKEELEI